MKTTNKKLLTTLCSVMAGSLLSTMALAATTPTPPNTPQSTNTQTATQGDLLHVQNIQDGPVSVQFRYKNGELIGLRLENTQDKVLKLSIMGKEYVVGKDDSVVINIPKNQGYVYLSQEPYHESITGIHHLLNNRFKSTNTYSLPKKSGLVEENSKQQQDTTTTNKQ